MCVPSLSPFFFFVLFFVSWEDASFLKLIQGSSEIFPKQVYSLLWASVSLSVKGEVRELALCSLKPQSSLEMP